MLKFFSIAYRILGVIAFLLSPWALFGVSLEGVPLINAVIIFIIFVTIGSILFWTGTKIKKSSKKALYVVYPLAVFIFFQSLYSVLYIVNHKTYHVLPTMLGFSAFFIFSAFYLKKYFQS